MSAHAAKVLPEGEVTFRGRGRAVLTGRELRLQVCPRCSQRNASRTEAKGYCQWCAYVPSLNDVEAAQRG